MTYDRICDVPVTTGILIPWIVEGCHKVTGARTAISMEMRYGAHPKHSKWWGASNYNYLRVLSTEGFRTVE